MFMPAQGMGFIVDDKYMHDWNNFNVMTVVFLVTLYNTSSIILGIGRAIKSYKNIECNYITIS